MKSVFCMRLSTAGVVLGWLAITWNLIYTIMLTGSFAFNDKIANYIMKEVEAMALNINEADVWIIIFYTICILLANAVLSLFSWILLVMGTVKNNHLMLLPWLVFTVFQLTSTIAYISIWTYVGIDEITAIVDHSNIYFIYILIGMFSIMVLEIYIFCGIYSLFKEIRLSRKFLQGNTLTS